MKAALITVAALLVVCVASVIVLELVLTSHLDRDKEPLVVMAAWDMKPALQELAARYEAQTGRGVDLRLGSSKEMLALLEMGRNGDVLICSSVVERKRAVEDGLVEGWPKRAVAYLVPAIIVRYDNATEITSLDDLIAQDLSLAIADPEQEPMGRFAADMLEQAGLGEDAQEQIAVTPARAPDTVQMVSLGRVDAALAWGSMQQWEPDFLRVVKVGSSVTGVAAVRAAATTFCRDTEAAEDFIAFLHGPEALEILKKWQYAVTPAEALKAAPRVGADKLGREPNVPERWRHQADDADGEDDAGETP